MTFVAMVTKSRLLNMDHIQLSMFEKPPRGKAGVEMNEIFET